MTDWYLGHDDDLVVPEDQVYFDRLPSPDSWSHRVISGFGNSGCLNHFDDAGKMVNLSDQKPHQRKSFGRSNEVELSYGSCNLGGSWEDSLPWNFTGHGCSDLHFNNHLGSDSMDDFFLSSLLHDDVPSATHNRNPVDLPPHSQCAVMPPHIDSAERMLNFQSMSCDTDGVGSSKYFRTPPFSPSACSDNGHPGVPNLSYRNRQSVKELETMNMLLSDQEAGGEDSSLEESVLLGLKAVLSKLSSKTRLCFQDSLYRLAQRSQRQMSTQVSVEGLPLDRPASVESSDAQRRSARTVTTESETNTIDRAVANLMFHNPNGAADVVDLLPPMLSKLEHKGKAFGTCNYGSTQAELFSSPKPAKSSADSEVPVFSH